MDDKEAFIRRAVELSRSGMATGQGGPFGALVVKDGEIIAEETNQVTSTNDPTMHAEMVAIRRACEKLGSFQLEDCEIYTSCEPCPMCLGAIYWARPKAVYFAGTREQAGNIGFDDAFIYDELTKPFAERSIPFTHVASEEAEHVFDEWREKSDKIAY